MKAILIISLFVVWCETATYLQLTDLHLDLQYKQGSNASCERSACCHADSVWVPQEGPLTTAGEWGSYRCDSPLKLLQNTLEFGKSLKPDYVVFTGDDTSHFYWAQTREGNLQVVEKVTQLIMQYFPNTPVFPSLGNHETTPLSQFEIPVSEMKWLLSKIAEWYKPWLSEPSYQTFLKAGFFTELIKPGLRIVSLNTLLYDEYNFAAHSPIVQDPGGQKAWLESVFEASRSAGEKVYVIGHISPGMKPEIPVPNTVEKFSHYWADTILPQYGDLILTTITGHIHRDTFRVTGNHTTFLAPSITQYERTNPSLRVYISDDDTNAIVDYKQYWMNLTEANLSGQPKWRLSYTWSEEYNGRTHAQVANDLLNGDPSTWTKYWRNYAVREITKKFACEGLCKSVQVCSMFHLTWDSYKKCILSY